MKVLVDTGPLVAILHADDMQHGRCKDIYRALNQQLLSVWPVVSEAMFLLDFSWAGQEGLWTLIESDAIRLLSIDAGDAPRMRELMHKYRDLPMDLADAALVRVAEREKIRTIFTTDKRDFRIYRPARIGRFSLL